MCPSMSLQFVTACEALPTEDPAAGKRPLSCMQPHVRSQQGRLPEGLPTTYYVADVLPLPNLTRPRAAKTKKHLPSNNELPHHGSARRTQYCYGKYKNTFVHVFY